jgi:hypothetical protein
MATRRIVQLEDDLSGGCADETLVFELDAHRYAIDLSAKNAEKLRQVFAPYVLAGRRKDVRRGRPGIGRTRAPQHSAPGEAAAMRKWGRANGYKVSSRGRIPAEIRHAFETAR